jgi:hypothetical protein
VAVSTNVSPCTPGLGEKEADGCSGGAWLWVVCWVVTVCDGAGVGCGAGAVVLELVSVWEPR